MSMDSEFKRTTCKACLKALDPRMQRRASAKAFESNITTSSGASTASIVAAGVRGRGGGGGGGGGEGRGEGRGGREKERGGREKERGGREKEKRDEEKGQENRGKVVG